MKFPELFCEKGQNVKLIRRVQFFDSDDKEIIFEEGTIFIVDEIVEYGFDLLPVNHKNKHPIRLLNSEMPVYFQVELPNTH